MIFRVHPSAGEPLYVQLMQQVRYGIETGVLQDGDLMPGIRTLAEELAVSHNTVAKAYGELQHEGLLVLRHGSGAYVSAPTTGATQARRVRRARESVRRLVQSLKEEGFADEEIHRLFAAEVLFPESPAEAP